MTINQILEQHALWLKTNGKKGSRANLTRANLEGANLEGTIGNLSHLKSVFCETYLVTYTAEVMQIGCQRHKIENWWRFDDDIIIAMDGKRALKWWRIWKPILQQIIAASPATGYMKDNSDEIH